MRMLRKRAKNRAALLGAIFLASALCLGGCSGDDGQNQDDALNDVTRDNSRVVDVSGQGVSAALAAVPQAAGQATSAQPRVLIQPRTVNCTQGSAEVAGDVTNNAAGTTFNLQIDFNNCNNLNGVLDVDGTAQRSGSNIGFVGTIGGTVTGDCTLVYTNFIVTLTSNNSTIAVTIDGQLDATCGTNTVSCDFVDVNTSNRDDLRNSCS